jgi:hypothetical protein
LCLHTPYYGGSVALRFAPFRRSRIYAYETFSAFRCPIHFLHPVLYRSLTVESVRQLHTPKLPLAVSSSQVCYDGCTLPPLEVGVQPIQASPLSFLGFLARRTCGASPYIPSGLTALLPCCFPLCLSTPGRAVVLEGTRSRPPAPSGAISISAETAHGMRVPAICVLFNIFIGQHGLKRAAMQVQIKHI